MLAEARRECSKTLEDRVKLLKAEQTARRRTSKPTTSTPLQATSKTCDCDLNNNLAKILVQELSKLKENDYAGLVCNSIAIRLKSFHPSVAHALVLKFLELLAAASN